MELHGRFIENSSKIISEVLHSSVIISDIRLEKGGISAASDYSPHFCIDSGATITGHFRTQKNKRVKFVNDMMPYINTKRSMV
jgi:hypothetical protein